MADGQKDDPVDTEKAYKDYCLKESDDTYTIIVTQQGEYDKQLLALSSGLLAVVVAFLKDVVHLDTSILKPLLYGGFVGLGLTIILVIASFQASVYALDKVRDYWKEQHAGNLSFNFPEGASQYVTYMNWLAGVSFVCGVALVFAFVTVNLSHQSKPVAKGDEKSVKECVSEKASDNQGGWVGNRWSAYQKADDCPKGEYCTYKATIEESIGIPAMKKNATPSWAPHPLPPICPGLPAKPPIKHCVKDCQPPLID